MGGGKGKEKRCHIQGESIKPVYVNCKDNSLSGQLVKRSEECRVPYESLLVVLEDERLKDVSVVFPDVYTTDTGNCTTIFEVTLNWSKILPEIRRYYCCWCVKRAPDDSPFQSCSGCGCLSYCSKECQTIHWRIQHKFSCKHMLG